MLTVEGEVVTVCTTCCDRAIILAVIRWTQRLGFDPRQVHVVFSVYKELLGQVPLRIPQYPLSVTYHQCPLNTLVSPVSNIPPMSSQYLGIPCQYHTTNVLSIPRYPLPVTYHQCPLNTSVPLVSIISPMSSQYLGVPCQ